jgi:hypothetical protein
MVFTDCKEACGTERLWCSGETRNTSPKLISFQKKLAQKEADLGNS